jgi:hypothetical protein
MRANTAQVVDFQAYRERRAAASRLMPAGTLAQLEAPMPVVWCPVWMFVPVVMVAN